jgi:hypothetical protein
VWVCVAVLADRAQLGGCAVSRLRSWVGPVTCGPGTAGPTLPAIPPDSHGRVLAGLLERVLAGDLVTDWVSVERQVMSALAALERIYIDHETSCVICSREWSWPWRRRRACAVRSAFAFYMPHAATADLRRT